MGLYKHQLENKLEIQKQWETHPAVLYQLPTGGGKTVVITSIIEDILDKKIIILVHRVEIILQIRDRLREKGINCGILVGNMEENVEADILIGSILTVSRDRRLGDILDRNFDYMIIDEAHHACSNSYIKTINSFKEHNPQYKLLGVTATPYRKDGKSLDSIFDVIVKGPTYSWLRENKFLAGYKCYPVKLEDLSDVEMSGGDYKLSDLSKFMRSPELIKLAIDIYKKRGNDAQMLVFCVDIKHAQQVMKAYIEAGYTKIAIIDSNTSDEDRRRINRDYRNGIIQIIVSIQTLTEGVDLPETKVIQLLRPTLSIVLYLQILGRGTRLKEDGSDVTVLDCSNNTFTHGLLDSDYRWSLSNENPNPSSEGRKIVGKRKDGSLILDEDEIGLDFEEAAEITHSEYLAMHGNGIEIAEKENEGKDALMMKMYQDFIEDLNKKAKNSKFRFKMGEKLFEWNKDIDLTMLDDSYGKILKITNKIDNKNNKNREITQSFSFNNLSSYNSYEKNLPEAVLLGKAAEYIEKNKIFLKLRKISSDIWDIEMGKIDINLLKDGLRDIQFSQLEEDINYHISKGGFYFELTTPRYIDSRAIGWGATVSISLEDQPKKLKASNKCLIRTDRGSANTGVNLSKEKILDALLNNWVSNV